MTGDQKTGMTGLIGPWCPHDLRSGFTLLEVLLSLVVVGGLLLTVLYSLNYHLGVADRHAVITVSTYLAKDKLLEMEQSPAEEQGQFPEPYGNFRFETSVEESGFPGLTEIGVTVRSGDESVHLGKLVTVSGKAAP